MKIRAEDGRSIKHTDISMLYESGSSKSGKIPSVLIRKMPAAVRRTANAALKNDGSRRRVHCQLIEDASATNLYGERRADAET